MADNFHPRVFYRRATKEFGLAVGFLSVIDGVHWLAMTRGEAEAGIPGAMVQLDPHLLSEERNSASGEVSFLYRESIADAVRFPPDLSDGIATEIEAVAWNETDLLGDIPESDHDAKYLARTYAELAAIIWEDANEQPEGYLPSRIIDVARRALVDRINAEVDRRERVVALEYQRRLREGLIDMNGVGNVPTFYGMLDEQLAGMPPRINLTSGQDSGWKGPITSEVLVMSQFANRRVVEFWHFECPECGFSDVEFSGPASSYDSIHCELCLEDGETVRLKRWAVEESRPDVHAA